MDHELDPAIKTFIRRKVGRIIGRAGFRPQDREDLEHEVTRLALERLRAYNSQKAATDVFLRIVVRHAVADIVRAQLAKKRFAPNIASLNAPVHAGDDLAQSISEAELNARRLRDPRSREELEQLRKDVQDSIDHLPAKLQKLARLAMHESPSSISRSTGIPESTVRDHLRQIRRRWEKNGLRNYL